MKAIYQQPTTNVLLIQTENLLNIVSNGDGTVTVSGGGDFNEETTEKLSRHSNLWDDEDE